MKKNKTIHIISQAHLDLAWLWSWRESYSEALNNINTVVRLMEKYPQLTFSYSNVIIYKWLLNAAPELFKKIQVLAKAGRWEIVGGWMVEADCNLPSGESLIRQALYGKAFIKEHFAVDVKIGYCPDAFGHCGELPKILKNTGYEYYVFSKPRFKEDYPNLFSWKASDGSGIITWRIHGGYATGPDDTPESLEQAIRYAAENNFSVNCNHTAFFLGLGDHGGGPSESQIRKIIELSGCSDLPVIKFSTLNNMFEELRQENTFAKLPQITGELHPHNIGCYSACGRIKTLNRKTEIEIQLAESVALISSQLGYAEYPHTILNEAWENLLFNQFHDILAGTCIARCYDDAEESLGSARHAAKKIITDRLHQISQQVDTSKVKNNALFVFNPLPWPRECIISSDMFTSIDGNHGPVISSIIDCASGEKIPIQFSHADAPYGPWLKEWKKLLVKTTLPPCGYKLLELSAERIEHHTITKRNTITGMPGIDSDAEFSANSIFSRIPGLIVCDDDSDTFGHDRNSFLTDPENVNLQEKYVIEEDTVRHRTRLCGKFNRSELDIDILTYPGIDIVELIVSGNWQEKNKVLKLEIPVSLKNPQVVYQTPSGHISRELNGCEVPGHAWSALTGEWNGKTYTIAVINSGIYSFDAIDSTMHLTLRRSVEGPRYSQFGYSKEEGLKYLDQGTFAERLGIVVIQGELNMGSISKIALEFQTPPCCIIDTKHEGYLPVQMSFFQLEAKDTVIVAYKKCERKDGFIIRLQEVSGNGETIKLLSKSMPLNCSLKINPFQLQALHFYRENSVWMHKQVNGLEDEFDNQKS